MSTSQTHPAVVRAAADFDQHQNRTDGARIAGQLTKNLATLRESLMRRLLTPDKPIMQDSMLLPVSKLKAQQQASEEIEAFMIAESTVMVRRCSLVKDAEAWYPGWLTAMRFEAWNPLGDVPQRVKGYLKLAGTERRLEFSDILVRVIPESRQAPLVLFRILPTAVHVATAQAFGDSEAAEQARAEQAKILPAIAYCQRCHGKLLEDGLECSACGNPLWNQEFLCAVD
jgi:hypothetical protein